MTVGELLHWVGKERPLPRCWRDLIAGPCLQPCSHSDRRLRHCCKPHANIRTLSCHPHCLDLTTALAVPVRVLCPNAHVVTCSDIYHYHQRSICASEAPLWSVITTQSRLWQQPCFPASPRPIAARKSSTANRPDCLQFPRLRLMLATMRLHLQTDRENRPPPLVAH